MTNSLYIRPDYSKIFEKKILIKKYKFCLKNNIKQNQCIILRFYHKRSHEVRYKLNLKYESKILHKKTSQNKIVKYITFFMFRDMQ